MTCHRYNCKCTDSPKHNKCTDSPKHTHKKDHCDKKIIVTCPQPKKKHCYEIPCVIKDKCYPYDPPINGCQEALCGTWSNVESMIDARTNFAAASGPDQTAGSATQVDSDPRVYIIGGIGADGVSPTDKCEKYNPNVDTWSAFSSLPESLGNISGAFVPDYTATGPQNLGYIYVAGGNTDKLFRYNIKQDMWTELDNLPTTTINPTLSYLDDVGGPLAQLFVDVTGVLLPACTDQQTLWLVGGASDLNPNQEQEVWYIQAGQDGLLKGEWTRGPDLPLLRKKPLIGRTFWRDAGITSFGVSNCASIVVCGGEQLHKSCNLGILEKNSEGEDKDGTPTTDVQLLVRNECDWAWITVENNPTEIPDDVLTLIKPVSNGAFGTEQWPETLATGGRPILFGGDPENEDSHTGGTQYAQFRFTRGRYGRDDCLEPDSDESAWNNGASMPGFRTEFKAAPLSQENSSIFGGRRISRFLCVGGRDENSNILNRSQVYSLPTPWPFLIARENENRCFNACVN